MRCDVLIVDDDADIRSTLAELLQDEGYEVMALADTEDLLAALARAQPRLILLDLTLPGQDLEKTLADARERSLLSETQILALSGLEDAERISRDLGLHGAVRKPFSLTELMDRVRSICREAEPFENAPFDDAHP